MEPGAIADYQAQGVSYLTDRYRSAAAIPGLARAMLARANELETVLWGVYRGRMLSTAVGTQLDVLGDVVGQARDGLSDSAFAIAIALRVAVDEATGRFADWQRIVAILLPTIQGRVFYDEGYESLVLGLFNIPLPPLTLATILAAALPIGVRGVLWYTTWAIGNELKLGSTYDATAGGHTTLGSVYSPTGSVLIGARKMTKS